MRPLVALGSLATFLAVSRPVDCTQAPRVEPGMRIRFDARSIGGRQAGTLVRWESDTLVVWVDADPQGLGLVVPVDSVSQIDVLRERRMTLEGAGLGLLGGTLLALVATPDCVDENGESAILPCLAYKVSPHLDTRVMALGLTGLLLGTAIGSETKSTKWVTVPLQRLTVGGTPDGGLALGVRISF